MDNSKIRRIRSISEFHRFRNLPPPEHPLISVINFEHIKRLPQNEPDSLLLEFYSITLKRDCDSKIKYGHQQYDFEEGVMFFIAPNQVFGIGSQADENQKHPTGWILLIHPDLLWGTSLSRKMKQYEYFSYSVHEALFLSGREEVVMNGIVQNIEQEYHSNSDNYSQSVIVAQTELLLTYAERFYNRQFLNRKINNHQLLSRLDNLLSNYFGNEDLIRNGLPTVQFICESINVSMSYLSRVLKMTTGQSTQQHIHNKIIEVAKDKLSTTNLSVSEVAYQLGFEYPQSFSKLFKAKTALSPLAFRQMFN